MAILDLPPDTWHAAQGITWGLQPAALIPERTGWRAQATRNRLALVRADAVIFDVALDLAVEVGLSRAARHQ